MEQEDLLEIEKRLRSVLRSHGIAWLVDQVDAVVREGKPEFKRPEGKLFRDPEEMVSAALTRERGILASEPYTERERVHLFVDAIRRAFMDAEAIEKATASALLDEGRVESVQFVDEFDAQPAHDLRADRGRTSERRPDLDVLENALASLEDRTR